jgi:cell division protein FtsZ
LIRDAAGVEDVQINFGIVPDESIGDEVKVTVIATGFQRTGLPEAQAPQVKAHAAAESAAAQPAAPAPPEKAPTIPETAAAPAAAQAPAPAAVENLPTAPLQVAPEPAPVVELDFEAVSEYAGDAQAPLELEFVPEEAPREPDEPAGPPPEEARDARPEPVPISDGEDDFALDDIDTPPILRLDRRLY